MGIDHRRLDVVMTQEFLDSSVGRLLFRANAWRLDAKGLTAAPFYTPASLTPFFITHKNQVANGSSLNKKTHLHSGNGFLFSSCGPPLLQQEQTTVTKEENYRNISITSIKAINLSLTWFFGST